MKIKIFETTTQSDILFSGAKPAFSSFFWGETEVPQATRAEFSVKLAKNISKTGLNGYQIPNFVGKILECLFFSPHFKMEKIVIPENSCAKFEGTSCQKEIFH